jgi:hypothetical protein
MGYLVRLFIIFMILPIHEFAHAWTAHKLGDDTAKYQGRLTLNPIAHLDPIGAICLLIGGFGWAKPVPIDPSRFSRKHSLRFGVAITALAGPVSNLIVAVVRTSPGDNNKLIYLGTNTADSSNCAYERYVDGSTPWVDLETALASTGGSTQRRPVRPNAQFTLGPGAAWYDVAVDSAVQNGTVATNKAYLQCDVDPTSALGRSLTISFGDNLTGIDNVENGEVERSLPVKRIVKGNLVIEKGGQMFNAAGAKLY